MEPWLEQFAKTSFESSGEAAHDLKTPLNVAMLNLELLRMRVRKIGGGTEDERVSTYAAAIECELRRMAAIFDAYFIYSTPPHDDSVPSFIDAVPVLRSSADRASIPVIATDSATILIDQRRLTDLFNLYFDGIRSIYTTEVPDVRAKIDGGRFRLVASGKVLDEVEVGKIFKFYYTDLSGTPELALASARLIAETYGGTLTARRDSGYVNLELDLPTGEG